MSNLDHDLTSKKVFIMIGEKDRETLVERFLKSEGYDTKTSGGDLNTSEKWLHMSEIFNQVIDFSPHIIICDVDTYRKITKDKIIFKFLAKIREFSDEDNYPLNMIIFSSMRPSRDYRPLIDAYETSPIDLYHLSREIVDLLQNGKE